MPPSGASTAVSTRSVAERYTLLHFDPTVSDDFPTVRDSEVTAADVDRLVLADWTYAEIARQLNLSIDEIRQCVRWCQENPPRAMPGGDDPLTDVRDASGPDDEQIQDAAFEAAFADVFGLTGEPFDGDGYVSFGGAGQPVPPRSSAMRARANPSSSLSRDRSSCGTTSVRTPKK